MRVQAAVVVGIAYLLINAAHLPAADGDKPIERIAFGSCASQERPQPIWEAIVREQPELFIFLGDNIYADTEDLDVMRAKYGKLAAMPGFQKLRASPCRLLAVWDDHDYGKNDAGLEYPKKVESQKIFLDFFNEPADSPRRKRAGLYDSFVFGPEGKRVQIVMLDTRTFRTRLKKDPNQKGDRYLPDDDPKATFLGEEQWKWLAEQFKVPAELRIICSSIQVVPEEHPFEKWANFPHERQKLFDLLRDTKAEGVIFISGDRHLAELSMMDAGIGYPIYDLTSSGLNQGARRFRAYEPNRHRVGTNNWGNNSGMINIDWSVPDPLLRLQIRDEEGEVTLQQKLPLSTLKPGAFRELSGERRKE